MPTNQNNANLENGEVDPLKPSRALANSPPASRKNQVRTVQSQRWTVHASNITTQRNIPLLPANKTHPGKDTPLFSHTKLGYSLVLKKLPEMKSFPL